MVSLTDIGTRPPRALVPYGTRTNRRIARRTARRIDQCNGSLGISPTLPQTSRNLTQSDISSVFS